MIAIGNPPPDLPAGQDGRLVMTIEGRPRAGRDPFYFAVYKDCAEYPHTRVRYRHPRDEGWWTGYDSITWAGYDSITVFHMFDAFRQLLDAHLKSKERMVKTGMIKLTGVEFPDGVLSNVGSVYVRAEDIAKIHRLPALPPDGLTKRTYTIPERTIVTLTDRDVILVQETPDEVFEQMDTEIGKVVVDLEKETKS